MPSSAATPSAAPAIADLRDLTVNEVLARWPGTVAVFNRFGIDACCGGARRVEAAALEDGAYPQALIAALRQVAEGS